MGTQARWSATANELKQSLDRGRKLVFGLTITGAVLVTLGGTAADFDDVAGKALGVAGAVALALASVVGKRSTGREGVCNWVRARSVSEGLKTELYF